MTYTSNFCTKNKSHCLVSRGGVGSGSVLAAESGVGVVMLDDLEKMARVLRVKVVELFFAPGRTAAERVVLGLLEGNGN